MKFYKMVVWRFAHHHFLGGRTLPFLPSLEHPMAACGRFGENLSGTFLGGNFFLGVRIFWNFLGGYPSSLCPFLQHPLAACGRLGENLCEKVMWG